MTKLSLALALAMAGAAATAQETRELSAHEHGVGRLNVAMSGGEVAIELEAPGMDVVGFEFEAESAEDRARVDAVMAALAEPLELFVLPAAAECVVTEASAELVGEHDDEGEHDGGAAEEAAHAEGENDHAGEEALAEGALAEGEAHEAGVPGEGEGHAEFQARYLLTCANPEAIDGIDLAYFAAFPNARELEVQVVSDAGAQGFEVTREAPRLDLAGSM